MSRKYEITVRGELAGQRVDRAVAQSMRVLGHDVSNSRAKSWVESGLVRIDGRDVSRASERLSAGQFVVLCVPEEELVTAVTELIDLADAVVFRDEHLLAINKPSGLPTHATHDANRDHAHAGVQRLVDGGYVAVHHRLDVETSGVLVFAIDRAANKGLADSFSQRRAQKSYLALVTACPDEASWEVENHLGRDRHERQRMCAVHSGGDPARTLFTVLHRRGNAALLEARPHTGRKHQIRVHLSGIGAPILGDVLYGGATTNRVMLHARELRIEHPVTGEPLSLQAEVPADFRDAADRLGLEID